MSDNPISIDELHAKIYKKGLLQGWAKIVIKNWKGNLEKLDANRTKELARSFKDKETPSKVVFEFVKHGRYLDMGVGKGMPIGSRKSNPDFFKKRNRKGELHHHIRKPKKWYSKQLGYEVHRLTELISKEFGLSASEFIQSYIPKVIEL